MYETVWETENGTGGWVILRVCLRLEDCCIWPTLQLNPQSSEVLLKSLICPLEHQYNCLRVLPWRIGLAATAGITVWNSIHYFDEQHILSIYKHILIILWNTLFWLGKSCSILHRIALTFCRLILLSSKLLHNLECILFLCKLLQTYIAGSSNSNMISVHDNYSWFYDINNDMITDLIKCISFSRWISEL